MKRSFRPRAPRNATLPEKLIFYSYLAANGCIIWWGAQDKPGYPRVMDRGHSLSAHRVAWELVNGPIPSGQFVCHTCDNPSCINVDHLWVGTHTDNMRDMINKGRKKGQRGADNARAKFTEDEVRAIHLDCRTQRVVAASYGVTQTTVSDIRRGRRWKHLHLNDGAGG